MRLTYFNSRPSARGDDRRRRATRVDRNFNSRPSARGDRPFRGREVLFRRISIHAPPRGATRTAALHAAIAALFQFTPLREGRRWRLWLAAGWLCYFNSRPSARGDRSCRRRHAGQAPFQFTPLREGRPSTAGAVGSPPAISIHAPPRGATFSGCNAIITEH